jgi:hypothetical protein
MARRTTTLAIAALLLQLLPLVAAHGEEHHGEAMDMSVHSAPAPQPQSEAPQNYWRLTEYATLMYWHIALEVLAWIVILPVGKLIRIRV